VLYIKFGKLGISLENFFNEWRIHYLATLQARAARKAHKLQLEASQRNITDFLVDDNFLVD
jgi:hypothetical protein